MYSNRHSNWPCLPEIVDITLEPKKNVTAITYTSSKANFFQSDLKKSVLPCVLPKVSEFASDEFHIDGSTSNVSTNPTNKM